MSDESGFSLVEVVCALGVLLVLMLMGLRITTSVLTVETEALGKGRATTQVVSAFNELRQEIVSANILFDPAYDVSGGVNYAGTNADGTNIAAGWSLRIYTQLNGLPMCVEWRLLDDGSLQTRSWSDQWQTDGIVHPWATLASGVVNPVGAPPFALNYATNFGGTSSRLIIVNLYASPGTSRESTELLVSSIAGRDAEYYPTSTGDCLPVPSS